MRVTRSKRGIRLDLSDLNPGENFRWNRQIWVVSNDSIPGKDVACTNLQTGAAERFKFPCKVTHVHAKVVIE